MGLSCGRPKPECHHISRDLPNPMVTANFEDKHFIMRYHILCVQCTHIHKLGWGAECTCVWKSGSGCFPLWLPTLSFEISHWILRSLTDLTGWPAISGESVCPHHPLCECYWYIWPHLAVLHGCWGCKLRFLCLRGRHSTSWTISPAPKMTLIASFLKWLKSTLKLSTISHQFLSVTLRNSGS